jgi:hypothetical protein
MANTYRNEVEVTLNGTKYLLRPTFECLAQIEEFLDKSIFQFMASVIAGHLKAREALFVLETAIKAGESKVDQAELKRNMGEGGLNEVTVAINTFLTAATMPGESIKKN